MKKIIAGVLILAVAIFVFGFSEKELNAEDYVKYVESDNNALMNTKEIDDLSFKLQYCPTEYLLLMEYKTDNISNALVENRKKENDSLLYFKLRISAKGTNDVMNHNVGSTEDYYSRIQYLSYGLEENIALLNGNDTIFPALFHFERTYGIAPFADFIMAFHTKIKESDDFQVLIDDKAFDSGILKFTYNNKDIQNIPKLKTN